MIELEVPGWRSLRLRHLVLDVNGTLTCDGEPVRGVPARIKRLKPLLDLHLVSADTFGRLDEFASALGVSATRLAAGEDGQVQKAQFVRALGAGQVAAIGNGVNDARMLREAALGIVILGPEGAALEALLAADVVVGSPLVALDLLLNPRRLVATLRR